MRCVTDIRGTLRPISVAPMMQRTTRHFRLFMRQITRRTLLYTEMVTTWAILRGHRTRYLRYHPDEHPIALQLGGDDPRDLAECARIAADLGYDEINFNVGCPSDRVQRGAFGACLMRSPKQVADAVAAMRAAVDLPVTVKHRIGVDELDRFEDLSSFVELVAAAGCDRFTVHARKAWLKGLSPKENRTVPPLRYGDVYALKSARPDLPIELNGGIVDLDDASAHLERIDAVMIGRAAWDDPYLFADADRRFFGVGEPPPSRGDVVLAMLPHLERGLEAGDPLPPMVMPMLGLFAGQPGTGAWKRHLAQWARPGAGIAVVREALEQVPIGSR